MFVNDTYYTIDEGERGVVLRAGSVNHVAGPGLNFKFPIIDSVVRISVQDQKRAYEKVATYSKDVQLAMILVSVNYKVLPDAVDEVYARYGTEIVARAIDPIVPDRLKKVFGQYQAATVVAERVRLGKEVEDAIKAAVPQDLIQVVSVQIENIDFSDAYEAAIEAAAKAEAAVRQARNELERQKVEAERVVVDAKARADAVRAQALAEAERIKLAGEAEATAIRAKGDALRDNPNLVGLIAAERWNGVLPTTQVPGSAVPFIELPQGGGQPRTPHQ
jgi:regulator of protease activity HflC (stomatin/prohibitin superfamily)